MTPNDNTTLPHQSIDADAVTPADLAPFLQATIADIISAKSPVRDFLTALRFAWSMNSADPSSARFIKQTEAVMTQLDRLYLVAETYHRAALHEQGNTAH